MTITIKRVTRKHHYYVEIRQDGKLLKRPKWTTGSIQDYRQATNIDILKQRIEKRAYRIQIVYGTEYEKKNNKITSTLRIWVTTLHPKRYNTQQLKHIAQDIIDKSGDIGNIHKLGEEEREISREEAKDLDTIHWQLHINKNGTSYNYEGTQ